MNKQLFGDSDEQQPRDPVYQTTSQKYRAACVGRDKQGVEKNMLITSWPLHNRILFTLSVAGQLWGAKVTEHFPLDQWFSKSPEELIKTQIRGPLYVPDSVVSGGLWAFPGDIDTAGLGDH